MIKTMASSHMQNSDADCESEHFRFGGGRVTVAVASEKNSLSCSKTLIGACIINVVHLDVQSSDFSRLKWKDNLVPRVLG